MKLKSTAMFLFVCLFAGLLQSSAQEKISLGQAVQLALDNNIQLKQAKLNVALSAEDYKQSQWALTPSLNANSNLNYSLGRSFDQLSGQAFDQSVTSGNGSLSSSVVIFQGFQRINQISQNKYALAADKSAAEKAKNDLVLNVVSTYLQALNAQDLVETAKQQVTFARMQLDREQKLFDVGNKTLADLSQAKAQFATADLNLTNAQNQSDLAFLNLSQLLERNPGSPFELEKPVVDALKASENTYEANAVYQTALATYPDIKLAEYRTLAAKKGISLARSGFSPRITFGGNLSTGYSSGRLQVIPGSNPVAFEKIPLNDQLSSNYSRGLGLGLSIPLWNGHQARSMVNKAKITYQNATLSEQLAKNNLNKVINQALYDLKAAQKRFESTQSAYNSSKEAFNVVEQRYNVGLVNSLDYYQTQVNLNRAAFDVIQAKYDLIFKTKVIDFYLGKPINF